MPGMFVVKKGPTGKFRFNLIAANGEIVAASEAYETKAACSKGLGTVRRLAADAVLEGRTARSTAARK